MKRLIFFLFAVFISGLITGCGSESAPEITEETATATVFQSQNLSKYTIVYGESNPEYAQLANTLADHFLETYDAFLTTAGHTQLSPTPYEIVLGDTDRTDRQGRIMEYSITVESGKFFIHAGGAFSAQAAIDYLCRNIWNGEAFTLEEGEYYETSLLTKTQAVADGTSARIMSANVLADAFADSTCQNACYRAEIFAGMLISYTPDILGLQETDETWNEILDVYLEKIQNLYSISYTRHLNTYENKVNYTSLLYRSDKFQVENSGVHLFPWWTDSAFHHNYHMRNISWAQFVPLDSTQKAFLVASTHWSYRTEHANGSTFLAGSDAPIAENQLRLQCKDETDAFLTTLRQTYPETPIFLTGDFNTSLSFFTDSGWTPTGFQIISEEAKASGKSISLIPASGHYDHLFGSGTYTIKLFGSDNEHNEHSTLTDHPFVYADIAF